jgi:DNA modification methylase
MKHPHDELGFSEVPFHRTNLGASYRGDALHLLRKLPGGSANLVMTSPPYALHFKKEYGNADQGEYLEWLMPFAREIFRVLNDDGSFVLNLGGAWRAGTPTRSLYQFEVLVALCKVVGFHLAQDFYWYNPAKLPSPAEWVTVRKIRVKDAVECLWWLSKTPHPKADNRRVQTEYSADLRRLVRRGYRSKIRPSGHVITSKFRDRGGAIPPNVLIFGNNDATGTYLKRCAEAGIKPHPARYPIQLPSFFVRFLTEEGDLVLDPFAGSNTTGEAAEREGRRWLAFEKQADYLRTSLFRFDAAAWAPIDLSRRHGELNGNGEEEASLFGT